MLSATGPTKLSTGMVVASTLGTGTGRVPEKIGTVPESATTDTCRVSGTDTTATRKSTASESTSGGSAMVVSARVSAAGRTTTTRKASIDRPKAANADADGKTGAIAIAARMGVRGPTASRHVTTVSASAKAASARLDTRIIVLQFKVAAFTYLFWHAHRSPYTRFHRIGDTGDDTPRERARRDQSLPRIPQLPRAGDPKRSGGPRDPG